MTQSAFSSAFNSGAAAEVRGFSDGEGTYTSPAGVATSGVDYAIEHDPADELDDMEGTTEEQLAVIYIATADVAAPAITGKFTDADSVVWAVRTVEIEGSIAALGVVRTSRIEASAVGGHRMETER